MTETRPFIAERDTANRVWRVIDGRLPEDHAHRIVSVFSLRREAFAARDALNDETEANMAPAPKVAGIAGIAGGVGTTVVAQLLSGDDLGLNVGSADIIVARNDYRCATALVAARPRPDQRVLVIVEPGRALSPADFESALGRPVASVDWDPAIARADDAGIIALRPQVGRALVDQLNRVSA